MLNLPKDRVGEPDDINLEGNLHHTQNLFCHNLSKHFNPLYIFIDSGQRLKSLWLFAWRQIKTNLIAGVEYTKFNLSLNLKKTAIYTLMRFCKLDF